MKIYHIDEVGPEAFAVHCDVCPYGYTRAESLEWAIELANDHYQGKHCDN